MLDPGNDIDEAKDWLGNDIHCAQCDHRDLLATAAGQETRSEKAL